MGLIHIDNSAYSSTLKSSSLDDDESESESDEDGGIGLDFLAFFFFEA